MRSSSTGLRANANQEKSVSEQSVESGFPGTACGTTEDLSNNLAIISADKKIICTAGEGDRPPDQRVTAH
jgi:hypothetical protein